MKKIILILSIMMATSQIMVANERQSTTSPIINLEENDFDYFEVYSLNENGILKVTSEKIKAKTQTWKFTRLDENLKSLGEGEVSIAPKDELVGYYITESHFHGIYRPKLKLKAPQTNVVPSNRIDIYGGKFMIVSYELLTNKITKVETKLSGFFTLGSIVVLGDKVLLDAYIKSGITYKPFLATVNWKTGETDKNLIEIDGIKATRPIFNNIEVFNDNSGGFVFLTGKKDKKLDNYAYRFDKNGKKLDLFCLTKNFNEVISTIKVSKISENEFLYTGTYSKSPSYANGVFIAKSTGSKVDFFNSNDFTSIESFFGFAPVSAQEKINKKKEKKEKKGKQINFKYKVVLHDIIKKGENYALIGEAYFPTYITEKIKVTNPNGTVSYQNKRIFNGFKYTHAFVLGFDGKGALKWDNIFEIKVGVTPLKEVSFVANTNTNSETIKLVSSNLEKIFLKEIDFTKGNTIKENEIEKSGTEVDNKYTYSSTVYYSKNIFFTYGCKYTKVSGKKKKVFFLDKNEL